MASIPLVGLSGLQNQPQTVSGFIGGLGAAADIRTSNANADLATANADKAKAEGRMTRLRIANNLLRSISAAPEDQRAGRLTQGIDAIKRMYPDIGDLSWLTLDNMDAVQGALTDTTQQFEEMIKRGEFDLKTRDTENAIYNRDRETTSKINVNGAQIANYRSQIDDRDRTFAAGRYDADRNYGLAYDKEIATGYGTVPAGAMMTPDGSVKVHIDPESGLPLSSDIAKSRVSRAGQVPQGYEYRPGDGSILRLTDTEGNPLPTGGGKGGGSAAGIVPEAEEPPGPWNGHNPTKRLSTPRAVDNAWGAAQKQYDARKKKNTEDYERASRLARLGREFMALNDQSDTGGLYGWTGIGPVLRGVDTTTDSSVARMQAISAEITPSLRVPGSGSMSDFDVQMLERSTFGLRNPRETNRAIAQGYELAAQQVEERSAFDDWYFQSAGHMNGSESAWQRYVKANPIFDPQSPGEPKLNPNRESFYDYFARESGEAGGARGTSGRDLLIQQRRESYGGRPYVGLGGKGAESVYDTPGGAPGLAPGGVERMPMPEGLGANEGDEVSGPDGRNYVVRGGMLEPR